ncbi:MAG: hypothetical protein LBR49_08825 [Tannerella sp.]|nr:hypothetical protein [Tannerella sp.]
MAPEPVTASLELCWRGASSGHEVVAHHQSLSEGGFIVARHEGFDHSEVADHKVGGIVVVALVGSVEEGFAGIFFGYEACLHPFVEGVGVAQYVIERLAEVAPVRVFLEDTVGDVFIACLLFERTVIAHD